MAVEKSKYSSDIIFHEQKISTVHGSIRWKNTSTAKQLISELCVATVFLEEIL